MVVALAAVLVIGGAVAAWWFLGDGDDGPGELSAAEARSSTEAAMLAVAQSQDPRDLGVRALHMDAMLSDSDFGNGTIRMVIAFGSNDVVHSDIALTFDGTTMEVAMYCSPEKRVLVYGEAYEQRPPASFQECLDEGPLEGVGQGDDDPIGGALDGGFFGQDGSDMEVLDTTPNADGSVDATVRDVSGETYEVQIDARGRLVRMHSDTPEGTFTIRLDHGPQRPIDLPSTVGRTPSEASCFGFAFEARWEASCSGGGDPLSEFEVRVLDRDDQLVAAFPLDGPSRQAQGDLILQITDTDGLLNDGDQLMLEGIGDGQRVVVWDLWADRDLEDQPIPATLAFLPVLLAAALFRRRRQP